MKPNSSRLAAFVPSTILFVSLYVLEFAALLIAMAIYKKGERSFPAFIASPAGFVFLVAVLALVTSTLVIVNLFRSHRPSIKTRFAVLLVLNMFSIVLAAAIAEAVIRVFAVSTPAGTMFANTLLYPRNWERVAAHNRAVLARASAQGSFLVHDDELGWTVGLSRSSKDYNLEWARQILSQRRSRSPQNDSGKPQRAKIGLEDSIYFSSVEGIRSPRVGMSFAKVPARRRIAIVGDSFTFGLEVQYEETWGHQLELALGSEFQVLNFGVDGYGVDQAYLRYQRDVLSWHPEVVILGVINDDFRRTMCVYGFLCFLGGEIPFPKPRFVMGERGLVPLNLPLPMPDSIFAKDSITELPFIDDDISFQRFEWERGFYQYVYSLRFLFSKYPRWPVPGPLVNDEARKSVNGLIFRSFVRLARESGSIPIVVYFPSSSDFMPESRGRVGIAREVLRGNGVPYLDMTDCVSKVSSAERFLIRHYSPATNTAVAICLHDSIREVSHG